MMEKLRAINLLQARIATKTNAWELGAGKSTMGEGKRNRAETETLYAVQAIFMKQFINKQKKKIYSIFLRSNFTFYVNFLIF